jgi:hypothetical protein
MAMQMRRVAVVVFADAPGVDDHDAATRLTVAVTERLAGRLPAPAGRGRALPDIAVEGAVALSTAARNGYLTVQIGRPLN